MRLSPEPKNVYTSLLGIHKANLFDEGVYTCKVQDWSIEQCRSIVVQVQSPPQLRVDPASVTLYRGESLRVRCLSPGNDQQRYGQLGYSWTKNGVLFQSDPNSVMWEDLYPDGSILKIQNIQKSAEFTCIVSNSVAPVSKSVHVTVIDRGIIELCPTEKLFNVRWPASAPGIPIITDCPKRYKGNSKRMCEQRDVGKSMWLTPDFSECIANEVVDIYNEFRALTLGYQRTNCSAILKSCLEYTKKRYMNFLPGEAGFLMDLLQEVEKYLKIKGTHLEREMAAEIILHILDKIMQNVFSLNSQQQIRKLQQLTQSAALNRETIAASQLATSTSSSSGSSSSLSSSSSSSSSVSSTSVISSMGIPSSSSAGISVSSVGGGGGESAASAAAASSFSSASAAIPDSTPSLDRLNSFRIYTTSVKTLPFNLRVYGEDLFSDQLYMEISQTKTLQNILTNGTVFVSIISYRNLTSFLPKTYFTRGRDDLDVDYSPASRIIATWLFQSNRSNDNFVEPLNLPLDAGHVEVIFQHESIPKNTDWTPICGHELRASYEPTWRTDLCITKNLMENITRCICPLSGTFVVLFAKKNYNTSIARTSTRPIFVIISCGCCFLQSCTAFAFLIPILYNRKCCITFLKMQFCTSTSTVMAIFLLGFLRLLPQDWHGIISSTLASLMILGLSTIVAITLIIQSELVPKKLQMTNFTTSSGIRGSIGISWLLPIIFSICSPLIYTIIGKWPISWWLECCSSGFILFIIVELLFISLFILLFVILLKKLLYLAKKHDKQNSSIWRRIGLLYRIAIILFLKLSADSLFLVYLNTTNNLITSHIFGVCCILLGFSILFCFVIKAEHNFRSEPLKKISAKTSIEEYCSGSINSPLSFYANHEIEKDNESGPPSQSTGIVTASTITSASAAAVSSGTSQQQTRLPLTILSGQCCNVIERIPSSTTQTTKKSSVETFLGCVGNGNGNENILVVGDKQTICDISLHEMETSSLPSHHHHHSHSHHHHQQQQQQQQQHQQGSSLLGSSGGCGGGGSICSINSGYVSSKSRCCNLILSSVGVGSGNRDNSGNSKHHHQNDTWKHEIDNNHSIYDTTNYYQNNGTTTSCNSVNNKIKCTLPESHEFVGVETLDILQGVSPDSIVGIRTSGCLKPTTGNLKKSSDSCSNTTIPSTASVTTQTPKSQKRVTIVEEPKKTILLPPSSSSATFSTAGGGASSVGSVHLIHHEIHRTPPPIIKITSSSGDDEISTNDGSGMIKPIVSITQFVPSCTVPNNNENGSTLGGSNNLKSVNDPIDGMLDRISHDLDYLLNRTSEIPTTRRTTGGCAGIVCNSSSSSSSGGNGNSNNVIICSNTTTSDGCTPGVELMCNQPNNNDAMVCSRLIPSISIVTVPTSQQQQQHQSIGTIIIDQSTENNTISSTQNIDTITPPHLTPVPAPPPPPPPPAIVPIPTHCRSVHEVIIEESEQE